MNIRNFKSKEMEISLFPKEHDIDILTMNETWLKSKFKFNIPNFTITHNDRPRKRRQVGEFFVRDNINFGFVDRRSSIDTDTYIDTSTLLHRYFYT